MNVFGPVPSRRLGSSLGVSPIPPKTCTYSCIYCQLGRTTHLTDVRQEYIHASDIIEELAEVNGRIDYVTFSGDGEPTLNISLGRMIRWAKDHLPYSVAVITNGSLLFRKDVRRDLMDADVVLPSLDSPYADLFRKINRPHPNITFEMVTEGLRAFSSEYEGDIWLEIMLMKGINDEEEILNAMAEIIDGLEHVERTYINVPIRPPAVTGVRPPSAEKIRKAVRIIPRAIALGPREEGRIDVSSYSTLEEAIMEITSRHPLRMDQAEDMARQFSADLKVILQKTGLEVIEYVGTEYIRRRPYDHGN